MGGGDVDCDGALYGGVDVRRGVEGVRAGTTGSLGVHKGFETGVGFGIGGYAGYDWDDRGEGARDGV